jgi:hypothetical protein
MKYVIVAVRTQPLTNIALIRQKINSSLRQNYALMCSGGGGGMNWIKLWAGQHHVLCTSGIKISMVCNWFRCWDVLENNRITYVSLVQLTVSPHLDVAVGYIFCCIPSNCSPKLVLSFVSLGSVLRK